MASSPPPPTTITAAEDAALVPTTAATATATTTSGTIEKKSWTGTDVATLYSSSSSMIWIPRRGSRFPECWLNPTHVISIYYGNNQNTFIELSNGKTVEITYATEEEAQKAAKLFVRAMKCEPSQDVLSSYPNPIGGNIRGR